MSKTYIIILNVLNKTNEPNTLSICCPYCPAWPCVALMLPSENTVGLFGLVFTGAHASASELGDIISIQLFS